ncbi:uncharacterized protein LOC130805430 [Amaranthus tricolor]|uniref:uncharacterized protein LOC130805430 n=1 Tax=Amaranthus tricolor TaxID=29722 RepID=UPI00258C1C3E|nr:uncharacterized protein LOC130805430 [Amaranthus tricolor]
MVEIVVLKKEIIYQLYYVIILIRCPVKSLARFKSVCKEWNSIISSPEFVHSHFNFSKSNPNFVETLILSHLYDNRNFELRKRRTTIKNINGEEQHDDVWDTIPIRQQQIFRVSNVVVIGSCNGLLCIYIQTDSSDCYGIWNPCISHFRKVLSPKCDIPATGFGYVDEDYKIFLFEAGCYDFAILAVNVYSLKSNSWTEISLQKTSCKTDSITRMTPSNIGDSSLHVTASVGEYAKHLVEIWSFEDEEKTQTWTMVFKLNVSHFRWFVDERIQVVAFTKAGKIVMRKGYKLFMVDLNRDPLTFVVIRKVGVVFSYHESLVSPYNYKPVRKKVGDTYHSYRFIEQGRTILGDR